MSLQRNLKGDRSKCTAGGVAPKSWAWGLLAAAKVPSSLCLILLSCHPRLTLGWNPGAQLPLICCFQCLLAESLVSQSSWVGPCWSNLEVCQSPQFYLDFIFRENTIAYARLKFILCSIPHHRGRELGIALGDSAMENGDMHKIQS